MTVTDDVSLFHSIPECAALLSRPHTSWTIPDSRIPKHDTEDSLFAETIKTSRNLANCIVFYQNPPTTTATAADTTTTSSNSTPDSQDPSQVPVPEIGVLMQLGDGLNGFPNVLHGGIVATLIDESMGMLQFVNREVTKSRDPTTSQKPLGLDTGEGGATKFTLDLRIRFLKPVVTPGVVYLVVKNVKLDGRKQWISAELKQFVKSDGVDSRGVAAAATDGEWVVCSTGDGLWVEPKKQSPKI